MPKLHPDALKALHELSRGGKIEVSRVYPHPHRYKLVFSDLRKTARYELSASVVASLVALGYIRAVNRQDENWDQFDYTIHQAGIEALKSLDVPFVDPLQLSLLGNDAA